MRLDIMAPQSDLNDSQRILRLDIIASQIDPNASQRTTRLDIMAAQSDPNQDDWDDRGPSNDLECEQWLKDKLPCPCANCNGAILCLRQISLEHVENERLWISRKRARIDWSTIPLLLEDDPHWSVFGGGAMTCKAERQR
ncbi:hypothetical protein GOP47_0028858 [Adiantum capillus-veneris]|nr:hypothetical protein GOP47_0028858 [Adiantum capillus-veneris]